MRAVGIRELKNRLSAYLRLVRSGEVVLVTDRGEVVAELRPPGSSTDASDIPPKLLELARQGLVTMGPSNDPALYPLMSRVMPEGTSLRLLEEERGNR
ncbi:MAG TPA: type II toxin-antitoxin system prevent-host-death family antitoxin [Gemmatimonadota bacterium]|nr:type II toxin-antitoxin system prevent-host-death family antitoxin [Gemmatimonadota bacterium]